MKTRNEDRDIRGLNESYNCVLVPDPVNKRLKLGGASVDQITAMALRQVHALAACLIPAWVTLPMRPVQGTYAAYFGLLTALGNKRSIPVTWHLVMRMPYKRFQMLRPALNLRISS